MKLRIICTTLMIIATISFACSGAKTPSTGNNGTDPGQVKPKGPAFEELYGRLYSEDYKESDAAMEIFKSKPEEYSKKILEQARKMDPELSDKAIEVIGRMKLEEGRELIKQALESNERSLRIAAIKAVGFIGETDVTEKLLEYSRSDDTDIRGNAANVLGGLADQPGVLERLRELAVEDDIKVRMAAYSSLGKAQDKGADHILYNALIKEAGLKAAGEPLGSLVTGLAGMALQQTVEAEDCSWLIDGLGSENYVEVRYTMFETVAKLKCPEAVTPLAKITRDTKEDDMTRIRAGFFLASIGDTRGYHPANDIFFAVEQGLLEYNATGFQEFQTFMGQYRGFLDEMEAAINKEKAGS